jgi:uncharacterized membrane protein YheB (UPF0754 family)
VKGSSTVDLWAIIVVLPLVGALIGYTTKWVAIQLIFKPANFVGVGPVGWQGVVQRRAPKFAAGIAQTVTGSALDVHELFGRIDTDEVVALLAPALEEAGPTLARAIAESMAPGAWDTLNDSRRTAIMMNLSQSLPPMLGSIVDEVQPAIPELLEIPDLIVERLSGENADRLARLFRRLGERELQFLIWYGAFLGFLIGVVEAGAYAALERWWLLPLVGAIDGLVNNWLAIQMIFRPFERTRYLGVLPYQGLFPARQREIAHNYAEMVAQEILTIDHLVERLGRGDAPARLLALIQPGVDERLAAHAQEIARAVGHDDLETGSMVPLVVVHLAPALAPSLPYVSSYIEESLDLSRRLEERLAAMPKPEFERVLRGIFEEDEAVLIVLGGVIGAAIGTVQAALVVFVLS